MVVSNSSTEVEREKTMSTKDYYVHERILHGRRIDNPFSGYDADRIGDRSLRYLQDTVDAIGADRFDRLSNVRAYVQEARDESGAAAASDD